MPPALTGTSPPPRSEVAQGRHDGGRFPAHVQREAHVVGGRPQKGGGRVAEVVDILVQLDAIA